MLQLLIVCLFFACPFTEGSFLDGDYKITLTSNAPVVIGGTVEFVAKLCDLEGNPAKGSFIFEWSDNAIKQHIDSHSSDSWVDTWNVSYPSKDYPFGRYDVQVIVKKVIFVFHEVIASERISFELTRNLNGYIAVFQQNNSIDGMYVSTVYPILHKIVLKESDAEYLKSATTVLTYWFIDCIYYGPVDDYTFTVNFTEPGKQHEVEAIIVASFDPIPTTPPTTETITASAISDLVKPDDKIEDSVVTNNSLILKGNGMNASTPINATAKNKTETADMSRSNNAQTTLPSSSDLLTFRTNSSICLNYSIPPDSQKTYGWFFRNYTAKAPVSNVTIIGNNWLQQGDMLSLHVKCRGSEIFNYCVHWPRGHYNVTGNETCLNPDTSEKCEFPIYHYFKSPEVYTVVIVISNDVQKVVTPVTVTVYKVNKQAQLSVIIVPVTFTLVAVVLIVFGVAYYLQNRSRFTIEVAEFNFGRQYTDMEYKTFTERLKESISNALMRTPTPSSSEHSVWPPGQKYGSLG